MSILWPAEDMPWTESGLTPDILFNPHGLGASVTARAARAGKGSLRERGRPGLDVENLGKEVLLRSLKKDEERKMKSWVLILFQPRQQICFDMVFCDLNLV